MPAQIQTLNGATSTHKLHIVSKVNAHHARKTDVEVRRIPNVEISPDSISAALQTSLAWDTVLELFKLEIQRAVPVDGLVYHFEEDGLHHKSGPGRHHAVMYNLALNGESLGELGLSRRKRFTEEDMAQLEHLLRGLVYPLRNALLYNRALHSAFKDPLTGVNNRAALDQALGRELDLAHRTENPLSLLMLDIDHFKQINDQYGHSAGDHALKCFTRGVMDCVRGSDIVYRFGGEEFVVLLSNTDIDGAKLLAERIREAVAEIECEILGSSFKMTVSAGVASLRADEGSEHLFHRADEALYQAKLSGRNRVETAA